MKTQVLLLLPLEKSSLTKFYLPDFEMGFTK